MARTIQEIYDGIIAEKEGQSSLSGLLPADDDYQLLSDDLTSSSKVAIWRLWAYITAAAIYSHELVYDLFKTEVEEMAAAAEAGTPGWYQKKALEFQFGDSLTYSNYQYVYDPVNPANRIIARAAIEERNDGAVIVKVAKDDNGSPVPLITAEINALESYMQKVKFAGTRMAIISANGDELDLNYTIYYDPLIPLATLQANLQTAMDAYLANLDFNAEFRVTKITDALQAVEGVVDPVFSSASATPDNGNAVNVPIRYVPVAGYFQFADTAANMFTFIEQV